MPLVELARPAKPRRQKASSNSAPGDRSPPKPWSAQKQARRWPTMATRLAEGLRALIEVY